jgi:hypothetical protein
VLPDNKKSPPYFPTLTSPQPNIEPTYRMFRYKLLKKMKLTRTDTTASPYPESNHTTDYFSHNTRNRTLIFSISKLIVFA